MSQIRKGPGCRRMKGGLETQTRLGPCVSVFFLLFLTILNYIMTSYGTTKKARASTNEWGLETQTRFGPCVSIFFFCFFLTVLNYSCLASYGTTKNSHERQHPATWPTMAWKVAGCRRMKGGLRRVYVRVSSLRKLFNSILFFFYYFANNFYLQNPTLAPKWGTGQGEDSNSTV